MEMVSWGYKWLQLGAKTWKNNLCHLSPLNNKILNIHSQGQCDYSLRTLLQIHCSCENGMEKIQLELAEEQEYILVAALYLEEEQHIQLNNRLQKLFTSYSWNLWYVTLHGIRDFDNVIKNLSVMRLSWTFWWPDVIARVLLRGKQEV